MTNDIPLEDLLEGLDEDLLPEDSRDDPMPDEVQPVNWKALTSEEAPAIWVELADWVDWFIQRYQYNVKVVPACWYKHGDLVEELSALHTAWKASYSELDGGYGPIGWHERLTIALQRLSARYPAECSSGHTTPITRTLATVSDTIDFRDWARTSHA